MRTGTKLLLVLLLALGCGPGGTPTRTPEEAAEAEPEEPAGFVEAAPLPDAADEEEDATEEVVEAPDVAPNDGPLAMAVPDEGGDAPSEAVSEADSRPEELRVHFIDVGQGDATLLEFPCGAILYDAGGEAGHTPHLMEYLEAFFARRGDLGRRLDAIVLSHPHGDHTYGAEGVFDTYDVGAVVMNAAPVNARSRGGGGHQYQLRRRANGAGVPVRRVRRPSGRWGYTGPLVDPVDCEGTDPDIRVLWGYVSSRPDDNPNNHSVVVRVDYGRFSLLLTGDLQEQAIDPMVAQLDRRALDVDVYQVGHHGSHNGTTQELVDVMDLQAAVFSMGDLDHGGSRTACAYRHPRMGIVEMLHNSIRRRRRPIEVVLGMDGPRHDEPLWTPEPFTIRRALFGTGWDGDIVITARPNGRFRVRRGAQLPQPQPFACDT